MPKILNHRITVPLRENVEKSTNKPVFDPQCFIQTFEYYDRLKSELYDTLSPEWVGVVKHKQAAFLTALSAHDTSKLALILATMYTNVDAVSYGMENDSDHHAGMNIANMVKDGIVSLAEYLNILYLENPEQGPHGQSIYCNTDEVLSKIEQEVQIPITRKKQFEGRQGIVFGEKIITIRDIYTYYTGCRIKELQSAFPIKKVCEIGGGLGQVAEYCWRLGIDYTIVDIPSTLFLVSLLLQDSIGSENVVLGNVEKRGAIKLMTPNMFLNSSQKYDLVINSDSMPEIPEIIVRQYMQVIIKNSPLFLSLNHELPPQTHVRNIAKEVGMKVIACSRHWIRTGYLETLYNCSDSKTYKTDSCI